MIITYATGLQGGSLKKGTADETAPPAKEDVYASFVVSTVIDQACPGLPFAPSASHDSPVPPVILKAEKDTITLGDAMKKFEDSFLCDKGEEAAYVFRYYFVEAAGRPPTLLDDDDEQKFL